MQKANREKWILAALAVIVMVAIVVWLSRSKDAGRIESDRNRGEHSEKHITESARKGDALAGSATNSHATKLPTSIHLQARLIGGANSRATISLGTIAPDDWVEINAQVKNFKSGGKAPKRASDLARFAAPEPIELAADANNNGLIDLPAIDPAAVYRFDAMRASDNAWYRARFVPAEGLLPNKTNYDIGDIEPILPTGIRITFVNAPPGQEDFELGLERRVTAETTEHASELLDYVAKARPDILEVLRGEAHLTMNAATIATLAPLPPDPSVHLTFRTLTGVEGAGIDVELKEQQIVDATIDLSRVFVGVPAGAISLRGRLLLGDSDLPIGGATIERENAPISGLQTTNADGLFAFEGLPPGVVCHFRVSIPRAETGRPLCPARATFDYTAAVDGDTEQHVDWRVPAYQWLVLKMSKEQTGALGELAKKSPIGQPIYILQQNNRGMWIDGAADEFIPADGEMAVSLTEPGDYRVAVAANPVYTLTSSDAQIGKGILETIATLPEFSADATARTLTVITPGGNLLREGRVWINGAHRSVPPIVMLIPSDGNIMLPPLNAEILNISVEPGAERIPTTLVVPQTGSLELRMPAP
ncbi:MAG: carboxypeptidase-like regulatory domain-containing protein [Candidatus Sumerlaeota bacterium]